MKDNLNQVVDYTIYAPGESTALRRATVTHYSEDGTVVYLQDAAGEGKASVARQLPVVGPQNHRDTARARSTGGCRPGRRSGAVSRSGPVDGPPVESAPDATRNAPLDGPSQIFQTNSRRRRA
jgi:hypothetical protein